MFHQSFRMAQQGPQPEEPAHTGFTRVNKYQIGPTIGEGTFGKFVLIKNLNMLSFSTCFS